MLTAQLAVDMFGLNCSFICVIMGIYFQFVMEDSFMYPSSSLCTPIQKQNSTKINWQILLFQNLLDLVG